MPTLLNNQAVVSYNYAGAATSESAISNVTTTTVLDPYSLSIGKTVLNNTFRPNDNLTYILNLDNSGQGPLYNVSVTDNLGGIARPLSYVDGSARVYINGQVFPVTPAFSPDAIAFTIPGPFESGYSAVIVYVAKVSGTLDLGVNSITNTAVATANRGGPTGDPLAGTPTASATVTRESFAALSIYKQTDKASVLAGEALTYTFTLTNTGDQPAESATITDVLPVGFIPSSVMVTINGMTTVYNANEYTVDPVSRTMIMPNLSGPPVVVPAASTAGPGVAVITIEGLVV